MWKTFGCATLVLCLASASAAAFEDASQNDEEQTKAARTLAPTSADLEPFSLRPTDVGPRTGDVSVEGSPLFQISGVAMLAASGADFATTEMGISRGLAEGNPIASNRSVRLLHHVIGPAAVWWTTTELQKKGKTRLATSLRIALMAAYGYATLHNLRQVSGIP
jgi:hypothetical protein